jgi:hypothetical protein
MSAFVEMRTFKERLFEAAECAKIDRRQTAIGASLGLRKQTVDRWFHGGEPSPEHLYLIQKKWGVSAEWLSNETGTMIIPSQQKKENTASHDKALHDLLATSDTLNPGRKKVLIAALELIKEILGGEKASNARGNPDAEGVQNAKSSRPTKRPSAHVSSGRSRK